MGRQIKERPRGYKRLFFKTLFITISIFAVMFLAGWLTLRGLNKPPDVSNKNPLANDGSEPAFHMPEDVHEDKLIGGELSGPEGVSPSDRKPDFYTFLIFGLDNGVNTDSIMVAAYDAVNKKAYVIGIPRDGKVNVKRNTKKINAAYPNGTVYGGGRDGGIEQLQRELKTIIGFVPDFYICIDFRAFTRIVDAVQGVDVYVPYDMVYDDPSQDLHINIPSGSRTLNGENALKFARYRTGNEGYRTVTDYQRIENQQAVIKALLQKLFTPASLLKIPEFIDIFFENVYTDISFSEAVYFGDQFMQIRGLEALETYTMPTTGTTGPPSYFELFDKAAVLELINDTINPYMLDIRAEDLDIAE